MNNDLSTYSLENLREKEEELLRKILGTENSTLDQLRRIYISNILTSDSKGMQYNSGINEENYDYYQLLTIMEPIADQYGFTSKQAALDRYLSNRGYLGREEAYREFEEQQARKREQPKPITPTDIAKASKNEAQKRPGRLSKCLGFVSEIFSRLLNSSKEK